MHASEVRTSVKKNESYSDSSKVHRHPLSPRRAPSDEVIYPTPTPVALMRRPLNTIVAAPPPTLLCRCCGHNGHQRDACPHLYQNDANNTDSDWAESPLGRTWLRHGHSQYKADLVLPSYEERYSLTTHGLVPLNSSSSISSSSKHARFEGQAPRGDQRQKYPQTHYQPGQTRCKSPPQLAWLGLDAPSQDHRKVGCGVLQSSCRRTANCQYLSVLHRLSQSQ
jgi:hypothetical protein